MDRKIISFDTFEEQAMCNNQDCRLHSRFVCPLNKWGGTAVDKLPLAMVYGPMQQFGDVSTPEEGLQAGTMFKNLNKPFYGKRVR